MMAPRSGLVYLMFKRFAGRLQCLHQRVNFHDPHCLIDRVSMHQQWPSQFGDVRHRGTPPVLFVVLSRRLTALSSIVLAIDFRYFPRSNKSLTGTPA